MLKFRYACKGLLFGLLQRFDLGAQFGADLRFPFGGVGDLFGETLTLFLTRGKRLLKLGSEGGKLSLLLLQLGFRVLAE